MQSKYRKILCQNRIKAYQESENDQVPDINIFDAINFISNAWNQVTVETIKSSWNKTKIINYNSSVAEDSNQESEINEINDLINELPFTDHLNADEFITIDQNLVVQEEMTDDEIVKIVKQRSENEDDNETDEPEPIVTGTEAIKGLEVALKYVQQKNLEIDFQIIKSVNKLKREISHKSFQEKVQTRMEDYFMNE